MTWGSAMPNPPLGDPPAVLKPAAAEAWQALRTAMPWLTASHRGLVELASILKARETAGLLGASGRALLARYVERLEGSR